MALVLLATVGGFVFWRVRTPPKVGEDFAKLSPAVQKERRDSAHQLETQVKNLVQSAEQSQRKPFTLAVQDSQLNTMLQDQIRTKNAPIKDIRAGISPAGLALQGTVDYKGFNAVVTMNGTLSTESGKLFYSISSLQIGGFPAPKSLRKNAEKQVARRINKYLARTPGTIQSVEAQDGKFVISGVTG